MHEFMEETVHVTCKSYLHYCTKQPGASLPLQAITGELRAHERWKKNFVVKSCHQMSSARNLLYVGVQDYKKSFSRSAS